ncbi:hypothetical protein NDU88_001136 [Pleurodeles waltl]|uniref:Uncharacterized protein n=1 Tax=Pleurodeles waltl TaxID=8319 RepID=A0AAV7WHG7_PLEWA|nr:hypothetical protein NDU88_001136 [Pleurodeles waltl]
MLAVCAASVQHGTQRQGQRSRCLFSVCRRRLSVSGDNRSSNGSGSCDSASFLSRRTAASRTARAPAVDLILTRLGHNGPLNLILGWSTKRRKEDEAPAVLLDFIRQNKAGTVRYPHTPSQPVRSVIKRVIYDVIAAVAGLAGIVRVLTHALKISMAPKTARNSGDKIDESKMTCIGRNKGDLAGANRRPHRRRANQLGTICLAQGKTPRPVTTPPPCWRQGSEDLSGALDNSTIIRRKERGPLAGKEQPQAQLQAQRSENQTRVGATSAPSATSGIEERKNVPPNLKG